jgi:hypothetical protein
MRPPVAPTVPSWSLRKSRIGRVARVAGVAGPVPLGWVAGLGSADDGLGESSGAAAPGATFSRWL